MPPKISLPNLIPVSAKFHPHRVKIRYRWNPTTAGFHFLIKKSNSKELSVKKVTIIEGCFDKSLLHSGVFCRVFDKVPKSRNNPHINTEPIIALTLLDCKNVFLMHPSIIHQIRTRYMMVLHLFTQNNTKTAVVCFKINNLHCFNFFKMFIIIVYEFPLRELFFIFFLVSLHHVLQIQQSAYQ